MSRLRDALAQIDFARRYTLGILDTIAESDWFRMPEGVTHVAWQVGHLAMAEYRLALDRLRGEQPDDEALIPNEFLKVFARDSVVNAGPETYPQPGEIRRVFDAVHARTMSDLANFPDADLDAPITKPHKLCQTKIECLRWTSHHEMIHGGQIALLRRLFGQKPIW